MEASFIWFYSYFAHYYLATNLELFSCYLPIVEAIIKLIIHHYLVLNMRYELIDLILLWFCSFLSVKYCNPPLKIITI